MYKLLKSIFTFLFFVVFVFGVLEWVFTQEFKQGTFFKTQWIYQKENLELDYSILGASRSLTAIDLNMANELCGKKGLNLSLDGSLPSTQYLILKLFLNHGNKIDHLIYNINNWQIGLDSVSHFSEPRFLPFKYDDIVYKHFYSFNSQWFFYRHIPFYGYSKYNFDWGFGMYLNSKLGLVSPDFDSLGCFYYPFNDFKGSTEDKLYLFDLNNEFKYLMKIKELCKVHGIRLTVITLPIVNLINNNVYQSNVKEFQKLLEKQGINFINYGPLYEREYKYFTDESHFNKRGVRKFTKEVFIKLLQNG